MSRDSDQREHARAPGNVCAWLDFQGERAAYSSQTVDIGIGGARFTSPHPVGEGEWLFLTLQLRPGAGTQCRGCVRWSREEADGLHHFGVQFAALREDVRKCLRELLPQGTEAGSLA